MGFRYDTQHLSNQQRAIIDQRDREEKLRKEESKKKSKVNNKEIYTQSIFMKLGQDATGKYTGIETLRIYEDFIKKNGDVWFSTNSLATGMAKRKQLEFKKAIKNDYIVEMYFAIGKIVEGNNDIVYKANVIDIVSESDGISTPDDNFTPKEWRRLKNKIWIKINKLELLNNLTSHDFIISSTKRVLADVISRSQYHFGYIERK